MLSLPHKLGWVVIGLAFLSHEAFPVSHRECRRYLAKVSNARPEAFPIESIEIFPPKDYELFPIDYVDKYDPDALYIGVENSAEAKHHFYLIIRNKRFEIKSIFSHTKTKDFGREVPLASTGILFELKVGKELASEIEKRLERNFHVDCLGAIWGPIGGAGIKFHEGKTSLWAATLDSALLQGKVFRPDGSPIPVRMLYQPKELKHFIEWARGADMAGMIDSVVAPALVVVLGGAIIYSIVASSGIISDPSPTPTTTSSP